MGRPLNRMPVTPEVSALVAGHMRIAVAATREVCRSSSVAFDDCLSAATWALWRCAVRYDPSRGGTFVTLAYRSCMLAAISVLRPKVRRIKAESLDAADPPGRQSVLDDLADEQDRRELVEWISQEVAGLGPRDGAMLKAWLLGERTHREIGADWGMTRLQVQQICARACKLIRDRYHERQRSLLN